MHNPLLDAFYDRMAGLLGWFFLLGPQSRPWPPNGVDALLQYDLNVNIKNKTTKWHTKMHKNINISNRLELPQYELTWDVLHLFRCLLSLHWQPDSVATPLASSKLSPHLPSSASPVKWFPSHPVADKHHGNLTSQRLISPSWKLTYFRWSSIQVNNENLH